MKVVLAAIVGMFVLLLLVFLFAPPYAAAPEEHVSPTLRGEPVVYEQHAALPEAGSGVASAEARSAFPDTPPLAEHSVQPAPTRAIAPPPAPADPLLHTDSYAAYTLAHGTLHTGVRTGEQFPIASITKLLTAMVAREQLEGGAGAQGARGGTGVHLHPAARSGAEAAACRCARAASHGVFK